MEKNEPYTFFYLTKGIISQIAVLLQQNSIIDETNTVLFSFLLCLHLYAGTDV